MRNGNGNGNDPGSDPGATGNARALLRRLLEASANSPLATADPRSLDELMARIPILFNTPALDLSDKDLADMCVYYHNKTELFATLARERADAPPAKRSRKTPALPALPALSSSDSGV